MSINWGFIWRNSSHDEDRDRAAVQRAFGDTPQQQVADTGHSFRADATRSVRFLATVASKSRSGAPVVITLSTFQPDVP